MFGEPDGAGRVLAVLTGRPKSARTKRWALCPREPAIYGELDIRPMWSAGQEGLHDNALLTGRF